MRFDDILTCAFAKTVNEFASGIISVESEIISQVYDAARWLDVMCVDELT